MTDFPDPRTPTSGLSATYDAWNRLVAVGSVQTNEYDGLHRRIIRDETGGSGDKRHFYYNENWQVIEERVEVAGTIDPDPLNQYVHHPYYVDAVAVRYYDATVSGTQVRHFYCHDANFNVTSVVNHSGSVQERYAYSPYGEVTFLEPDFDPIAGNASAIGNEILYTGRTRDPETALYDFRTRFYHAPLGRFTSRDWIEYGGGMNLYGYVGGMPTGYVDPWGLEPVDPGTLPGTIPIDSGLYVPPMGKPVIKPVRDRITGEIIGWIAIYPGGEQHYWQQPQIHPVDLSPPGHATPHPERGPATGWDKWRQYGRYAGMGAATGIAQTGQYLSWPLRWAGVDFSEQDARLAQAWKKIGLQGTKTQMVVRGSAGAATFSAYSVVFLSALGYDLVLFESAAAKNAALVRQVNLLARRAARVADEISDARTEAEFLSRQREFHRLVAEMRRLGERICP